MHRFQVRAPDSAQSKKAALGRVPEPIPAFVFAYCVDSSAYVSLSLSERPVPHHTLNYVHVHQRAACEGDLRHYRALVLLRDKAVRL